MKGAVKPNLRWSTCQTILPATVADADMPWSVQRFETVLTFAYERWNEINPGHMDMPLDLDPVFLVWNTGSKYFCREIVQEVIPLAALNKALLRVYFLGAHRKGRHRFLRCWEKVWFRFSFESWWLTNPFYNIFSCHEQRPTDATLREALARLRSWWDSWDEISKGDLQKKQC